MHVRLSLKVAALWMLMLSSAAASFASPLPLPNSGSLSGIVSSIDLQAELFSVLDGKIVIDASRATIQSTRGPESFAAITIGAEISAIIDPGPYAPGAPLKASVINVVSRPTTLLSGRVDSVDLAASTLTVLGKTIQVTPTTRFTSQIGGGQPQGIQDVFPNQVVVVELSGSAANLVAVKVTIIQPASTVVITFYGRLVEMQGENWAVRSADGTIVTRFRVTPSTSIVGNPQIGDFVNVTSRLEAGGYLAIIVSIASPPPPVRGVRLVGRLTELTNTFLVLTDANLVQTRFTVNSFTQFNGNPRVGDEVIVIGEVYASGEHVATRVEKEGTRPPSLIFTIVGTVSAKAADKWTVGRWTILISPRTSISGDIRVGDRVRVIGERQVNSFVIVAYEIHKE